MLFFVECHRAWRRRRGGGGGCRWCRGRWGWTVAGRSASEHDDGCERGCYFLKVLLYRRGRELPGSRICSLRGKMPNWTTGDSPPFFITEGSRGRWWAMSPMSEAQRSYYSGYYPELIWKAQHKNNMRVYRFPQRDCIDLLHNCQERPNTLSRKIGRPLLKGTVGPKPYWSSSWEENGTGQYRTIVSSRYFWRRTGITENYIFLLTIFHDIL